MTGLLRMTAKEHDKEGKTRVAAYCRVSTDKSEQQHSYKAQKKYFTQLYMNSESEEFVRIYADSGSGTSMRYRPDLLRMLEDCRCGRIDRVVAKSLSRFARNTKECLTILRELKGLGISVYFEKEAIDTARVTDEIMITILEGLAQEESASISENIRCSLKKRMMSGTLGIARIPYGYKKENGAIVIDQEKAENVKRIFDMYLSGYGAFSIAEVFNSEGIPSPTGIKWNNVAILKMLRQEKYAGDIRWQKTYSVFMGMKGMKNNGEQESYYIKDALPAIIPRELLEAAEIVRKNNTRITKRTNSSPFRGITKCVCGRSYYYCESGRLPIWICSGQKMFQNRCSHNSFFDKSYHQAWKRVCVKLKRFSDIILLPCIKQMQKLEEAKSGKREKELLARIEELSDRRYVLYTLCTNGCITSERLAQADFEISSELYNAEKELSFITRQKDSSAEKLKKLYDILNSGKDKDITNDILVKTVTDGLTIEFELIGGLKIKEVLE